MSNRCWFFVGFQTQDYRKRLKSHFLNSVEVFHSFPAFKMPMVGGTGEIREPDETVHQIARQIKDEAQSKTGLLFEEFTPVKYRSQLVNGTNYFIKVKHAPSEYSHFRVHRSFQGEVSLVAHQLGKKLEDEIDYFQ